MSEIVDKAKALVSTYEQLLEHTRTERDQLRAELAAAKEEIQTWRLRHRDAMDTATRKVEQAEDVAAERDRLAADNARLRSALELWQRIPFVFEGFGDRGELFVFSPVYYHNSMSVTRDALAATPAQSIAAHDAALLREVMNLIRQTTPDPVDGVPESFGAHQGRMYAIEQIGAEADRIEKEAPHA